ncbi:hypothetical protein FACS1894186_4740 [Alphaproteobacteria bacterium]|nr:hypothetical protein FACS1894186_4740 [Alphaproteobacteria bacterium]
MITITIPSRRAPSNWEGAKRLAADITVHDDQQPIAHELLTYSAEWDGGYMSVRDASPAHPIPDNASYVMGIHLPGTDYTLCLRHLRRMPNPGVSLTRAAGADDIRYVECCVHYLGDEG